MMERQDSTVAACFFQVISKGFGLETCESWIRIEGFLLQEFVGNKERSSSWMTLQPSESVGCELVAFTGLASQRAMVLACECHMKGATLFISSDSRRGHFHSLAIDVQFKFGGPNSR